LERPLSSHGPGFPGVSGVRMGSAKVGKREGRACHAKGTVMVGEERWRLFGTMNKAACNTRPEPGEREISFCLLYGGRGADVGREVSSGRVLG